MAKSQDKKKDTAETTATKTESKTESPAVSEKPVDVSQGYLVCTLLEGSLQVHLVKDETEEGERDPDAPRVDEVRSKILSLGAYVAVAEVADDLAESVKAGEIEHLVFAANDTEVKLATLEAQAARNEMVVQPERIYFTAEKHISQGASQVPLVGRS